MLPAVKEVLKVFADNNLFDEGVELIGSWCFQLYQKHLGARNFPLRTQDIDFLIPSPFHGREHTDLVKQLEVLGFRYDFKHDGSLYLWNAELKIEFMTPAKGRGSDRATRIKKLGIAAIPLRFVSMLLEEPITIADGSIRIKVPDPARFCLHKLIIASRRRKIDKCLKDLQQAFCTSVIVDDNEIRELFASLPRKWKQTIIRMLPKSRAALPLFTDEIGRLEFTLHKGL